MTFTGRAVPNVSDCSPLPLNEHDPAASDSVQLNCCVPAIVTRNRGALDWALSVDVAAKSPATAAAQRHKPPLTAYGFLT